VRAAYPYGGDNVIAMERLWFGQDRAVPAARAIGVAEGETRSGVTKRESPRGTEALSLSLPTCAR
jgi:hypothetical protein